MFDKYILVCVILLFSKGICPATVTIINEKNDTIVTLPSTTSSFGPNLFTKFIGHVIFSNPLNACAPVDEPLTVNSSLSFIGLVRRHDCSFSEKVLNVQKSGFKAVLVFDPNFDDLITMSGTSGSIVIPSFFIGKSSEEILSKYLGINFKVVLEDYSSNSGIFLIPLVIGMLLCLIFVIVFLLMRYTSGLVSQWRQRLSKSILKLLPLRRFKKEDSYDTCAVCLDDFKVNEKLRILPCGHAYHQYCIDPWLTENKRTCPLCNKPIFKVEQEDFENFLDVPNEQTPLITNQASSLAPRRLIDHLPSTSIGGPRIPSDADTNPHGIST